MNLTGRITKLAQFCRWFEKSQLYPKALAYYQKEIFKEKGDYFLSYPLKTITEEALKAYACSDLVPSSKKKLLLILGGNIPNPFLFTLFQALTAGIFVFVKPSALDPYFPLLFHKAFQSYFSRQKLWEVVPERGHELIHAKINADAILMFGANVSLRKWAEKAQRESKPFLGFGERLSGGVIGQEEGLDFDALAQDVTRYGQQGCFAPHFFVYLGKDATSFTERLFRALKKQKASPYTAREKGQIFFTLHHFRALQAAGQKVKIYDSKAGRVILLQKQTLPRFIGLRTVYVIPLAEVREAKRFLQSLGQTLSTLVVFPQALKEKLSGLAFRAVDPGKAQRNSVAEPHEGVFWIRVLFSQKQQIILRT